MSQETAESAVWSLVSDLFLRVRLEGLARVAGTALRNFTDPAALAAALSAISDAATRPRLVLLDLHARDDAAFTLLAVLSTRDAAPPTLGFHSHVDVAIRERALAAGCTRIVPRSAVMNRFAALVEEASASA